MVEKQCVGFLNTEPLWFNEQFEIQQFDFPALNLKRFKPEPLPSNIRLGHQMEYVFKQLVAHCDTYRVILHNLPVKKGKQTIGEIDFILEHLETQKLIHVELTYKFYIINPEIPDPLHQLIGPNKHDAFFAKMQKIKSKQFPLLHSDEAINALINSNIYDINIEHQCCFKAQLFEPYENKSLNLLPLNVNCIVGYWLRFDVFNTSEFTDNKFYIPNKSEWVIEPHDQVQWKTHSEISIDINQSLNKEKSPMVWMRKSKTEFEKFFVVWWSLERIKIKRYFKSTKCYLLNLTS